MASYPADTRTQLLQAAEQLLVASAEGDVSTRAVCDQVGVGQPVLYRIFGDKQGLLDALAETGLQRYAARKVELETSQDAVADLRAGWNDHMAFARQNPAIYRLMFSPRPGVDTKARDGILALVKIALRRCAAAGVLRRDIDECAAMILSANVGIAMNSLTQPAVYSTPQLSDALRDALFNSILTEPACQPAQTSATMATRQLLAHLELEPPDQLAPEERALLMMWLHRLTH